MRSVRKLLSLATVLALTYCFVFLTRSFVFELYVVQQQSMENTLPPGAEVVVDKGSMVAWPLAHGDIVVFHPPDSTQSEQVRNPDVNPVVSFLFGHQEYSPFIKRILGLPGDTVQLSGTDVVLNGLILQEPYIDSNWGTQAIGAALETSIPATGSCPVQPAGQPQSCWVVPADQYFVMGDHRDVSNDSRVFGPITRGSIIGRTWLQINGPGGWHSFNRAPWDSQQSVNYGS